MVISKKISSFSTFLLFGSNFKYYMNLGSFKLLYFRSSHYFSFGFGFYFKIAFTMYDKNLFIYDFKTLLNLIHLD